MSISANEPLAEMPARRDGLATIFTASGKIERVWRQSAKIGFFTNKPFWGPPRYGWNKIVLWPADTFFELSIAGATPVTVDGKRAGFADLAVGQAVVVQYQLICYGDMECTALRIDARKASAPKRDSRPDTPTKH